MNGIGYLWDDKAYDESGYEGVEEAVFIAFYDCPIKSERACR